jgi:hypothetical protein
MGIVNWLFRSILQIPLGKLVATQELLKIWWRLMIKKNCENSIHVKDILDCLPEIPLLTHYAEVLPGTKVSC